MKGKTMAGTPPPTPLSPPSASPSASPPILTATSIAGLFATFAAGAGAAVAALRLYSPFPRGKQSRPESSPPFFASDVCPLPSVAHQFYQREQWKYIQLSRGRVRYCFRGPLAEARTTSDTDVSDSFEASPELVEDFDRVTSNDSSICIVPPPSASASASAASVATSASPSSTHSKSTRVVVLVHGFSIAMDIWKQQADYLVSHGYSVLTFDNYGRGWSDAPDTRYDEELFVGQLSELLFALQIRTPIDLIGVSMGGVIVAAFAARFPQHVARLGLVCPAGLPIVAPPTFSPLVNAPIIGPLFFRHAIKSLQARGAAAQWECMTSQEYEAWRLYAQQNIQTHPGFVRSLWRTVTQFNMTNQQETFMALAKQEHLKTIIIWGEQDGLTPYVNAAWLRRLIPNSRLVSIADARHNLLIERGQAIAQVMEAWLSDDKAELPKRIVDRKEASQRQI